MTTEPIEQPKRKRRRWRQFSLRTMFVLLTIAAVLLALLSPPLVERRREQAVVRTIEAAGGRVTVYDYVPRFGSSVFSTVLGSRIYQRVRELDLGGTGIKDADLEQFRQLAHLRGLSLSGTKVTDRGLQHLTHNANLESLDLSKTLVTDAGLKHLKELGSLCRLDTSGTQITYEALGELQKTLPQAPHLTQQRAIDEIAAAGGIVGPRGDPLAVDLTTVQFLRNAIASDLRHLKFLPDLKSLRLSGARNVDKLLFDVESLTELEELRLIHTRITSEHLMYLRPLTKLRVLQLTYTDVDDAGLAYLADHTNLNELSLEHSSVTGLGFRHLEDLSQLEVLDLTGCKYIYDADLTKLHGLSRLRRLVLDEARVTATGIAELQKALPNAQIIVGGRGQRPPWDFGPTFEMGLPAEAEAAFWAGDYDKVGDVFHQLLIRQRTSWQTYLWLGHAFQLSDQWQRAVSLYRIALARLARDIADPHLFLRRGTSKSQLREEWAKLVLLVGRIQLEELKDPAAAAETLATGLRFAPEANRPINEIAAEAATAIEGLKSPLSTRPFNQRLWSDMMYPLTTHRYLAAAHEQLGDIETALECWVRIRLCRVGYRVAMADSDPIHIAALWSRLRDTSPLPPMPVFSVLTEQQPEVTLKPNTGQTRLTWWESNAWDTFAVAASPDRAVASLEITCTLEHESDGPATSLRCWADAASYYTAGKRRLLEHRWPKATAYERETRTFKVDVPFDANVLFIDSPGKSTAEIKVRATLRPRGSGAEWPAAETPQSSREAWRLSIDFPDSPFRPVSPDLTGSPRSGRGTSSLARLPDGRFLLAFGEKKITLAASDDGATWEASWKYSHNSVFPTGNPTMLVDDDGVIWMLYSSKRPGTDQFSTGYYYLWLTHSRDGRSWSTPKPIRTAGMLSNNTTAQMTRSPDGKYWIFLNDQVGSGNSPGAIRKLERLYLPIRNNRIPTGVHAAFEATGRCHLVFVFEGPKRAVQYSRSEDMRLWSPPTTLFGDINSTVKLPQLLIEGDRVALIYSTNKGGWIRRGTMDRDGPHLPQTIQFAKSNAGVRGSRFMQESGKIYLPMIGEPPALLVTDRDDLFGAGDN